MKYLLAFILLCLTFISCHFINDRQQNEFWEFASHDSLNLLKIKPTDYLYEDKIIYECSGPEKDYYNAFGHRNYLVIDGKQVKNISLSSLCIKEYKKGKYEIYDPPKKHIYSKDINPCIVVFSPLIDFGLEEKKHITFHNETISLLAKGYDYELKDTLYKFQIETTTNTEMATILLASMKSGIVGIYDTLLIEPSIKERIYFKVGLDYKSRKFTHPIYRMKKPSFDLSLIKEFVKR